jgi:cytochrome c-type biogenesis protein CcmE
MPPARAQRQTTSLILGVALLLGGSVGYMVYTTVAAGDAVEYFEEVDAAIADLRRDPATRRRVRLHGNVVAGTIQQRPGSLDHRFAIFHGAEWTDVTHRGILPDTLRDCTEVVVNGRFAAADGRRFVAEKVTGKCPSKYDERQHTTGCGEPLRPLIAAARR